MKGVAPASETETYAALRLEVDNWRWAGVPFFIRAGKALAGRVTEVRVILKRPPRLAFLAEPSHPDPTQVVLRIDPDPGMRIVLLSKGAGRHVRQDRQPRPFLRRRNSAGRPSRTSGCCTTR